MTPDEQHASSVIAHCAKEISARILAAADDAGLERSSFLLNVTAVLAASALAAQPESQRQAASRHIQNALGLVHCLQGDGDPATLPNSGFTAPDGLQ
jgi:hypothetical protein